MPILYESTGRDEAAPAADSVVFSQIVKVHPVKHRPDFLFNRLRAVKPQGWGTARGRLESCKLAVEQSRWHEMPGTVRHPFGKNSTRRV